MNAADKLSERLLESETGCWEFIGARTGAGYGAIWLNGKNRATHILAYELEKGAIPNGKFVLHECDNPACCRPDHLFLGTHQDNKDDEVAKDRHVYGERVGNHVLTETEVLEIRRLRKLGHKRSYVARRFGVSHTAIYYIETGRNWGWL